MYHSPQTDLLESVSMSEWSRTNLRRLFFRIHLPDDGRPCEFDAAAAVDAWRQAGVNAAIFLAKCPAGYAYYKTAHGCGHPGLRGCDPLGEILEAAAKDNIKVTACYAGAWDALLADRHPEWQTVVADWESALGRQPTLCLSGPYREIVFERIRELLAAYPVDGFWSDALLWGQPFCYCPACEDRFSDRFGQELPRTPEHPLWHRAVRWRYDQAERLVAELRALCRALRPGAAFTVHFSALQGERKTDAVQRPLGVSRFLDWLMAPGDSREDVSPSMAAQFVGSIAEAHRFGRECLPPLLGDVRISRFAGESDFTLRPQPQIAFEAFAAVSYGAAVTLEDEAYPDGSLEPAVYQALSNIYGEIERKEPWLVGSSPVRYAGVLHSQATRDYLHADGGSRFEKAVYGAYRALADNHLPVGFLFDEGLTLEQLAPYAVLYVPNAACLSGETCEVIAEYVKQGGGLAATGMTSLRDETGRKRPDFALSGLFGAHYEGLLREPFVYWSLSGLSYPLFYQGQCARVTTEAETLGHIWESAGTGGRGSGPYRETPMPVAVRNQAGGGKVVYVVGSPESRYAESGLPEYRWLIDRIIHLAASAPRPFWVEAPSVVELSARRLPDGPTVYHFLSAVRSRPVRFGNQWTPEVIENVLPVFDIRLHIASEPGRRHRAYLLPDMDPLRVSHEDTEVVVDMPEVRLWSSVLVEKED
ncbi:MAG: family 10 glycosylhydrolase [Armatimonadetes bacterium]|nr:family 10 glycosylhydrolase [Armatimonadota bacterium]